MHDPLVPSLLIDAFTASYRRYAVFNAERSLREHDHALEAATFGGLSAHRDRTRPSASYYNRIDGLGEETLAGLDEALAWFEELGLSPRLDLASERATLALSAHLMDLGFCPGAGVVVLVARPGDVGQSPPGGPSTRRLRPHEADLFFDLLEAEPDDAGAIAPAARERRRRHYCTDAFRVWLAERDGAPIGWATIWVDGSIGVLGNAFTREAGRGLGAQRSLMAARAADAAELGLDWLWTDVSPLTTSHRNAERMGFRAATTQLWWTRDEDWPLE